MTSENFDTDAYRDLAAWNADGDNDSGYPSERYFGSRPRCEGCSGRLSDFDVEQSYKLCNGCVDDVNDEASVDEYAAAERYAGETTADKAERAHLNVSAARMAGNTGAVSAYTLLANHFEAMLECATSIEDLDDDNAVLLT